MKNFMSKCFFFSIIFFSLAVSILPQFKNVKVNASNANQPNEVTIAINPANPNYIAAGSNLFYFYGSSDAGQTWTQKVMGSIWGVWGDPCVTYDGLGNLYFAHLSDGRKTGGFWLDRMVVQRSNSNGTNWDYDEGIGYTPPQKQQDKEWLAADLTNSKFKNNLYISWTEFDIYGSSRATDSSRILFSHSTNSGQSWSTPIRVNTKSGNCIDEDFTVEGAVPAVGPNGEVYLSWSGPLGITFVKSTDGGVSFSKNINVTDLYAGWDFMIPGINRCNGMPVTGCDISNSPYKGNVYISWSDQIDGDTDVFISKSTDGGTTWIAPKKVNDDILKRHQFFNWMCVDPITGKIYIVFYDRRDNLDPNSLQTHVYLARSDDGGNTFKNFRISETPFFPSSNVFFGDYTNIAAYNGKIYPIWMRMDGTTMSVWTAPIDDSQLKPNDEQIVIHDFRLFQNYPNPFNPETVISYQLPVGGFVSLKVFDALGKEIATLINENKSAGIYEQKFDAGRLSSGVYLYRLQAGNYTESKKMILAK